MTYNDYMEQYWDAVLELYRYMIVHDIGRFPFEDYMDDFLGLYSDESGVIYVGYRNWDGFVLVRADGTLRIIESGDEFSKTHKLKRVEGGD